VRGKVDVSTYTDEAITDPAVLELASKVSYEVKYYDTFPQALPGGVRIRTRDGRTLAADLPYQRGGPDNPMTAEEIRDKFRANAALALAERDVEALEEAIMTLERRDNLDVLGVLSRAARHDVIAA
jgi:2-methylcitrate dehydratase PrpD